MEIKIQEFKDRGDIPSRHSCDGKDSIPTITIKNIPTKTASLVLIINDPDATDGDTWDHCLLFNIPPETKEIHTKNIDSFQSGANSWGKAGYGGPCPPRGDNPHRYYFTLYALDSELTFKKPLPNSEQIRQTMKKHTLKEASYMGLYGRK